MSIEKLIEKSFNDLIKAITTDGTSSQLIFPCYRDGNERRSEQELRQIFLRNVEEDKTYFYSIETPTKYGYRFKDSKNLEVDKSHKKGEHQAARFDVSLYNNKYELLNHIEFKYGNPKKKTPICKDFLKLAIENKIEDKNDLSKVIVYLVCIHGKGKTASRYHFSLADLKKNYTVGTKYSDITDKLWLNEEIFNLGEEIHFKESKK